MTGALDPENLLGDEYGMGTASSELIASDNSMNEIESPDDTITTFPSMDKSMNEKMMAAVAYDNAADDDCSKTSSSSEMISSDYTASHDRKRPVETITTTRLTVPESNDQSCSSDMMSDSNDETAVQKKRRVSTDSDLTNETIKIPKANPIVKCISKPGKTTKKPQLKYDPDVPMTKEEAAIWRREQRRKRNRESAAASRQRQRDRITELESEVEQWKVKYDHIMHQVRELEKMAVRPPTSPAFRAREVYRGHDPHLYRGQHPFAPHPAHVPTRLMHPPHPSCVNSPVHKQRVSTPTYHHQQHHSTKVQQQHHHPRVHASEDLYTHPASVSPHSSPYASPGARDDSSSDEGHFIEYRTTNKRHPEFTTKISSRPAMSRINHIELSGLFTLSVQPLTA